MEVGQLVKTSNEIAKIKEFEEIDGETYAIFEGSNTLNNVNNIEEYKDVVLTTEDGYDLRLKEKHYILTMLSDGRWSLY